MIPKIVFRYSENYDEIVKKSLALELNEDYPSPSEIREYLEEVKVLWEKEEKRILEKISEIINLDWIWNKINCYVVGKGRNFSFPLTLTIWTEKTDFIDVLTHELIHRLEFQHQIHRNKWLKYLNEKYKKENDKTKKHILVFAIHKKIYLNFFNKERLNRNIKRNENMPEYKRAWEIVEQEGHENIIKEFRKSTK